MNSSCRSPSAFDNYYAQLYPDCWDQVRGGLHSDKEHESFRICSDVEPYFLDAASIQVARALPLEGRHILDMCSAPGGKSLVLLGRMERHQDLRCYEQSQKRYQRLKRNLAQFAPSFEGRYHCHNADSGRIGQRYPEHFDSILLDAPCSSERHVLEDPQELANWTPKRPKKLMATQYRLICSAWDSLKVGGYLMYSTCSINPGENDGVIERLMSRKGTKCQLVELELDKMTSTQYGLMAWPHLGAGGPMYCCLLKKI